MILVYHHIGKNQKDENYLSIESFRNQMEELKNYKVVELSKYDKDNVDNVVLRFDDGYKDLLDVLPILKEYKYPFSVFVVLDFIGKDGYLNKEDLKKVVKYGGNIQMHTHSHRKLTELSREEIEQELTIPDEIKAIDKNGFYALAYPYWEYNEDVILIAKEKGFKLALSGNGFGNNNSDYTLDGIKITEKYLNENKIVKYIDTVYATFPCNFRCHYCYIGQHCQTDQRSNIAKFELTPEEYVSKLSKKVLGGTAVMNFCAFGETLLVPQNIEYIEAVLKEGHFCLVVTNMTITKNIDRLLSLPKEYLSRLFFKCSFHYLELKKMNLLETFTNNVLKAWNSGASITVEITPSDELEPYIDEIKEYSLKHFGALPHITVPRNENNGLKILTKHTDEEFKKIWETFDSGMFNFKIKDWGIKNKHFCYAGRNSYLININTGEIYRCNTCGVIGNLKDVKDKLPDNPAGTKCSLKHCYNKHFWQCFGMIPDIDAPTYNIMRDRITKDGKHWVHARMRNAFNSKMSDTYKRSSLYEFIWKLKHKMYEIDNNITKIKFLGIPLLKIKKKNNKTKVYLFNFLPILVIKNKN